MTTSHISEYQEFELKSSRLCSKSSYSMPRHPSPWNCLWVSSKGHWLGTENATQWQSTYEHISQPGFQPQHHKRERVPIPYQNETAECELSGILLHKTFYISYFVINPKTRLWRQYSWVSTEQTTEEGNNQTQGKERAAICYWNTRKAWARNKFTQDTFC